MKTFTLKVGPMGPGECWNISITANTREEAINIFYASNPRLCVISCSY